MSFSLLCGLRLFRYRWTSMLGYSCSEVICLRAFKAESALYLKFIHEFWLIMIWSASVRAIDNEYCWFTVMQAVVVSLMQPKLKSE